MTAKIDLKKYTGSTFISLSDVEDGPLTLRIADIVEGQFEKLNLLFTSGERFSVNKTNLGRLIRELGDDTRDWRDADVKLFAGEFVDRQGNAKPGVELEVLVPETAHAEKDDGFGPPRVVRR